MPKCIFENLTYKEAIALADYFESLNDDDRVIFSFEPDYGRLDEHGNFTGSRVIDNGDIITYCKAKS